MDFIQFEKLNAQTINEHIAVGSSVYSSPEVVSYEHLKWKHLENPCGPSTSISLRTELNLLVGRSFIHPRQLWLDEFKCCNGATITDLVVAPANRSAATLIKMTRAIKSPENIDVVVHTSNESSDLIYQKLFKFPVAFTLAAGGLPIRCSNILKPYVKSGVVLRAAELLLSPWRWMLGGIASAGSLVLGLRLDGSPDTATITDVLCEHRRVAGPHFERTQAFISWRFSDGPIFNAKVEWLWRDGKCLGYLAWRRVSLGGLAVLVIMDAVLRRRMSPSEAGILKFMITRIAIRCECDASFFLANIENSSLKWLKGFPFVGIPDKHLPHSTPIFVHASEECWPLADRSDMFFTLADLDYF